MSDIGAGFELAWGFVKLALGVVVIGAAAVAGTIYASNRAEAGRQSTMTAIATDSLQHLSLSNISLSAFKKNEAQCAPTQPYQATYSAKGPTGLYVEGSICASPKAAPKTP